MENEDTPYCRSAERGGLRCEPCFDSHCTVKGERVQRLYEDMKLHDTITVEPDGRGGLKVECDIEIPFKVDGSKGAGRVKEIMYRNKEKLTVALGPKIPEHIRGPWFHYHYSANRLPDVAALHVHLAATAANPMEANRLSREIWEVVDADRLTDMLRK